MVNYYKQLLHDHWRGLIGLFILALFITLIQGCALFSQPVAEKVADAVDKYCQEPYSYRQIYRNTVNSQLLTTGHIVHVHCLGDPTTTP